MSKKFKCAIATAALASLFTFSAVGLTACSSSDHPQATITISFNDVTYDIEYTLYRNMYPQTVQHFIELADEGFYNNMIVHDYKSSDLFTGAYSYNEEDTTYTSSTFGEYLENNYKEEEYCKLFNDGKLTPSVYKSVSYDSKGNETVSAENALPTLIGEFTDNNHNIEKNPLSAKVGALKMYYYDKGSDNEKVIIKNWSDQVLTQDYKYNCATSVFAMQIGSSSYNSSKYCVFAELKNDSARDKLDALIEAIDEYKESESSKFSTSIATYVDKLDTYNPNIEVSFTMTSLPIIIKSVRLTKY